MKKLLDVIKEAEDKKVAIGHFNISNLEGLWAIFRAAKELNNLPIIIGVSEGERDFIGVPQVRALVSAFRDQFDYPIYLNADHTYSFERVKEVVDAGFDAVIFDGSALSLEENIKLTKQCVDYAKSVNPDILVEGELGFIGKSSKLLDELPEEVAVTDETITKVAEAKHFVEATGVDLLAPAVGNIHGMLKNAPNPRLHIERIKELREATGVPLVLHGGSGIADEDFRQAISAGISIIHINTELRVAYHNGLKHSLQEYPDEIAPYKILKEAVLEMQKVTEKRLKLFNNF
jgi:fructose-bisphosphate aldolase class II